MTTLSTLLLQWGPHHPGGPGGPMGPQGPMGPGGWSGAGTMPWGMETGLGWWLLLLLLVVAVAAVVVALALWAESTSESDDAIGALRARYARGEIDDEEFEHRRAKLDGGPAT